MSDNKEDAERTAGMCFGVGISAARESIELLTKGKPEEASVRAQQATAWALLALAATAQEALILANDAQEARALAAIEEEALAQKQVAALDALRQERGKP